MLPGARNREQNCLACEQKLTWRPASQPQVLIYRLSRLEEIAFALAGRLELRSEGAGLPAELDLDLVQSP